jgi:DDE superfamily endonuclease
MGWCGSAVLICVTALRPSLASACTNAARASYSGGGTSAISPSGRSIPNPIPPPRKVLKKLPALTKEALGERAAGKAVEVWFQDEARVGQQGTLTRIWARRGTRPRAPRDRRFTWAYLFGAVCPAHGAGAALVLPAVKVEAMNKHLIEIGKCVSAGAIALLVLDGAGWHSSPKLAGPDIVLLKLPPYAPKLNPTENIWEYLRGKLTKRPSRLVVVMHGTS